MEYIETLDEFRAHVERAGYGRLDDDELAFLKRYYDRAYEMCSQLHGVDTRAQEPAVVFKSASPS